MRIVQRQAKVMYAAIDAGEWDRLVELYTADCVYERPGYDPIFGTSALHDFYSRVRGIASGRHIIRSAYSREGGLAIVGDFSGTLKCGSVVDLAYVDIFGFKAGRIARRKSFFYTPMV